MGSSQDGSWVTAGIAESLEEQLYVIVQSNIET